METIFSDEVQTALVVAFGVVMAKAAAWGFSKLGDFVRGTPATWDDKLYAAFKKAINDASKDKPEG